MSDALIPERPTLSVITVSLNSSKFLRETLDSVARQTFRDFEHIVVDGGSTDGTQAILAEYPSIRWISEDDGDLGFVGAIHKAAAMARGKYVIQCFISDGFLDPSWFAKAVEFLETYPKFALVWSLPQQMSEQGALLGLFRGELLDRPPKDGEGFLAFWAAAQFVFPEGNYCTYTEIIREWFPGRGAPDHHLVQPHLGFVFNFMRRGFLSAMIPQVSSYFRTHEGQRYQKRLLIERPAAERYQKNVVSLWFKIVLGRERHVFRDPASLVLSVMGRRERARLFAEGIIEGVLRLKIVRYPPVRVFRYFLAMVKGARVSQRVKL
jgi:glycosyltransferase involved in cell wall biosynthesis